MLEFLHEWLGKPERSAEEAQGFLRHLGQFYAAEATGLSGPSGISCPVDLAWWRSGQRPRDFVFPWVGDRKIPSNAPECARKSLLDGNRAWLISLIGSPGEPHVRAWVLVRPAREFSAEESGLLALAGAALLQGLTKTHPLSRALEQARVLQDLERSARLTAKLAHDFGNLLTGILGFADLTLHQMPPGSVVHQFVTEVCHSAKEGAGWVRKLQTFSRRSSGTDSPGNLAQVVSLEEARTRTDWQGQGTLFARLPSELPPAAVDSAALQTAITELLENARQAQGNQGAVALSVREVALEAADCALLLGQPAPGSFLEVSVADSGPGLPGLIEAGRLDEAFIATRKRHGGLGLVVVYGIAMSCGGGLSLSAVPGQGSTVKLYVPVLVSGKKTPRPEGTQTQSAAPR